MCSPKIKSLYHHLLLVCSYSGDSVIISSILKIVIAASVANLMHLILDTAGSRTPAFTLSLTVPLYKSRPNHLSFLNFSSSLN